MSDLMKPGVRPEAGTERATLILAPNADPMTLDGTNTWLLAEPGARSAVVVDPGPLDEDHLRLVRATAEERELRIGLILLTHGHFDHSEGAPRLAELTGAPVRALDPRFRLGSEGLAEGDVVDMDGLRLDVVATPGHSGDSMCFVLPDDRAVLTGDTILGRGTTVVAHPDGRLGDYLGTLRRLRDLAAAHEVDTVLPGHGPVPADALGCRRVLPRAPPAPGWSRCARRWPPATRAPPTWWPGCTPTWIRRCGSPPRCRCAPSWSISTPVPEASERVTDRRRSISTVHQRPVLACSTYSFLPAPGS